MPNQLFPETFPIFFCRCSRPLRHKNSLLNVTVERGVRPIRHTFYQAVFDRIEMNVIHVVLKIHVIGDGVLPITPLPQRVFALSVACDGQARFYDCTGECALDCAPPAGEIVVAWRQRPIGVKVIGKNDDGVNPERVLAANGAERFT